MDWKQLFVVFLVCFFGLCFSKSSCWVLVKFASRYIRFSLSVSMCVCVIFFVSNYSLSTPHFFSLCYCYHITCGLTKLYTSLVCIVGSILLVTVFFIFHIIHFLPASSVHCTFVSLSRYIVVKWNFQHFVTQILLHRQKYGRCSIFLMVLSTKEVSPLPHTTM